MVEIKQRLPIYSSVKVLVAFILFFQLARTDDVEFNGCTAVPGATPKPGDPPLPTLPTSFQTRIEANIIDRKFTMSAVEYVDDESNRAVLKMWRDGIETDVYFDYANNQLFSVVGDQCSVTNITGDANTVIFGGGDTPPGGIPHVYSTSGVLHFAQGFGETYIGKATIRGQPANHWQSCMYWDNVKANFTLDYYFSDPTWNSSSGYRSVPLRADVVGVYTLVDAVQTQFHHIYEFIDFRDTVPDDPSLFETPTGVSCPNRKKIRDIPKLNDAYYYREEIIATDAQTVSEADVWYNFNWKLVRYDHRAESIKAPFWNLNPFTEIHDYSTGVSYAIDNLIKNCTIMPIENATWDSAFNGSTDYISLRNPQSLFFLDSSYTYSGQRKARGIDCDVFTSTRNDFDNSPTVFEMYFLSPIWYATDNKGLAQDTPDIPIRLTVTTVGNEAYPTIYELYDFDPEIPDIQTAFDVSKCYGDADKIDFRITFPTTAGDVLNGYRAIFIDRSIQLISSLAGTLSLVRVTKTEVHWDESNVYLIATILDKAPPIAKFRKQAGKIYQYQNAMQLEGVIDPASCAEQCDAADQFTCNSFDLCADKQMCSLSQDYASDGSKLGDAMDCDHYTRVLSGRVDQEISLNDAWIILTDQVVKGTFQFTITLEDDTIQTFKASDITSDILRNPNRQASKTALQHFTGNANKEVKGFDDLILTGMSVDDCASECLGEVVFTCQSFEYCYDTGYCVMSQQHPDERPDLIQNSDHCDLYTRQYTAKFTETPGVTVLSSSDTIYQNIFTDNQCAKLCVDYSEFDCKSFDYCPNINACFLGKKHVFDVPQSEINPDVRCNHYSRNYVDDFKIKANKQIALKDNRVVEGISAEQCAKLCVEEESFSCASFDYCGNMTECRLSDASMSDVGQVTVESSAYCAVYQRVYFPDGSKYTKPTSKGYSAGAMGGLGFAMLVIGAVLAIAVYFGIGKWRGKSFDSMTISFKNMENSE